MEKNPLLSFARQPKIYIKLPSNGEFWPENSLKKSINGEYAVYSMTARDELILKTPDSLLNGQAVVDVIENCIPNIKNAWHTPSIDLEAILIAIRLATYGDQFDIELNLGLEEPFSYTIDLRMLLDRIYQTTNWQCQISINEHMTCYIRPLCYKEITESSIEIFETQRIINSLSNNTLSDAQKISVFRESFLKLNEINVQLVNNVVYKIDSIHGTTDNLDHIKEFLNDCDREIFNKIKTHLDRMKEHNTLKPITVTTNDEQRAKGLPPTVDVPITFDQSSFFA